jgi:hypothetical protein
VIELSSYHQGFIAGYIPGLLMGTGLMKMAWDHERRQRQARRPRLPQQPIAADLIRYASWEQEQVKRALRNEPPTKPQPPGGRMIREGEWCSSWAPLNGPGYQPRPSQGGTPNPPPSDP